MSDFGAVLGKLRRVKPWGQKSQAWYACCPAHDDRHPSLILWVSRRGDLLAKCMAKGCRFKQIVEAAGTEAKDWWGDRPETPRRRMVEQVKPRLIAAYDYRDEKGALRYQVCRFHPKDFRQRRPGPNPGNWIWNLEGVEPLPYQLPELLAKKDQPVLIPEGEKDVETLRSLGFVATCNSGGAGKWHPSLGRWLRGRRCVILPDNDDPGQLHAMQVVGNLVYWAAASVRILRLPGLADKGDVTEWLSDGCGGDWTDAAAKKASLIHLVKAAPEFRCELRPAA